MWWSFWPIEHYSHLPTLREKELLAFALILILLGGLCCPLLSKVHVPTVMAPLLLATYHALSTV